MSAIEEFTDRFVEQLRQRLDVGELTSEYFVSDWLAHYRQHHGKEAAPLGLTTELLDAIDDDHLQAKAIADWNLLYLTVVYAMATPPGENADPAPNPNSDPDRDDSVDLLRRYPTAFLEQLATAEYASMERRHRPLSSVEELEGYLEEVHGLAAALRPHLSAESFASEAYQGILAKMSEEWPLRTWKDNEIKEHPSGYSLVRDGLMFNLVEHDGQPRMLCLGRVEL